MKDLGKRETCVPAVVLKVVAMPWPKQLSRTGLVGNLLNDKYWLVLSPHGSSPLPVVALPLI